MATTPASLKPLAAAAFWLGFALSGFFDGILLHQILQWHHLLSAIRASDIRFQVLADGYFHLLMYAIAGWGLWLLWRARERFGLEGASHRFLAWLLIGFGGWHVLDAVVSHWVLGIHRIRVDSVTPLAWDLGWLVAFGVLPLAAGLFLRRGGRGPQLRSVSVMLIMALLVGGAAYWASRPPPGQTFTTIVFAPYVSRAEAFAAAVDVSEAVIAFEGDGVVVVSGVRAGGGLALYLNGALLVSGSGAPAGCFAWRA